MSQLRTAGWASDSPTPAQLKEFFSQIESGRITKARLQSFLRGGDTLPYELVKNFPIEALRVDSRTFIALKSGGIDSIGDLTEKTTSDLFQISIFDKDEMLPKIRMRLAEIKLFLRGEEPQAK
jgi:DNA-directed RNA polymerase alpha subunit